MALSVLSSKPSWTSSLISRPSLCCLLNGLLSLTVFKPGGTMWDVFTLGILYGGLFGSEVAVTSGGHLLIDTKLACSEG